MNEPQTSGLAAMLMQLGPRVKSTWDRIAPLLDQPVERMPYNLPLSAGQVIAAGAVQTPLLASDFQNSLEWPFEVHAIKFGQDAGHTFRDWTILITEIVFSKIWMKASGKVSDFVEDNTGQWKLNYPFILRPKGGQLQIMVSNLDAVNPITVDINFQGYQLIPRAGGPEPK